MTHAQFDQLVSLHLDGALGPAERQQLEAAMEGDPALRRRFHQACQLNEACREALFRLAADEALAGAPRRRAPATLRWATGMAAAVAAMAMPAWLVTTQVANRQAPAELAEPVVLAAAAEPVAAPVPVVVARSQRAPVATLAGINFDTPVVRAEDLVRALQERSLEPMSVAIPQFLPERILELHAPALPAGSVVPVRRPEAIGSAALREAIHAGSGHARYPLATVRFGW